jgi:hypothetical protein
MSIRDRASRYGWGTKECRSEYDCQVMDTHSVHMLLFNNPETHNIEETSTMTIEYALMKMAHEVFESGIISVGEVINPLVQSDLP